MRDAGEPWSHTELNDADILITNPPWQRRKKNNDGKMIPYEEQPLIKILIALIETGKPVWLLLDSDWAYTVSAAPYLKYCHSIIAAGS